MGGEADGEVQHDAKSHLPTHGALKHLTGRLKWNKVNVKLFRLPIRSYRLL